MRKQVDTIVVAVIGLIAIALCWFVYWCFGLLPWRDSAILLGLFSIPLLPLTLWRFKRIKAAIYGLLVLSLAATSLHAWTPLDGFLQHFYSVRIGMTTAEARNQMLPYKDFRFETEGSRRSGRMWYDFEGTDVFVRVRDGRVVETQNVE